MSYVNPKVASKYFNVYEKHHLHMEYRRKIKYTTTEGGHKDTYSPKHQNKQIKLKLVSSKKTRDKKQKFKYLIMSYVNPKVVMYVKTPHENQTYPIPLGVSDYFF